MAERLTRNEQVRGSIPRVGLPAFSLLTCRYASTLPSVVPSLSRNKLARLDELTDDEIGRLEAVLQGALAQLTNQGLDKE
jgi:hypothetical protein